MPVKLRDWEAHHVKIATLDLLDEYGGETLDAVSPGFIKGLSGGEVSVDLMIGQGMEGDIGDFVIDDMLFSGAQAETGYHLVGVSAQQLEHSPGVGKILRFFQDISFLNHDGIRSNNQIGLGMFMKNPIRLTPGIVVRKVNFIAVRGGIFIHIRGADLEFQAQGVQHFNPPGRLAGQNDGKVRLRISFHPQKYINR